MSATIDPAALLKEPAVQLAEAILARQPAALVTGVNPLVALTAAYLADRPQEWELQQRAMELERRNQAYAVSLLVPDQEQLQTDLNDSPGDELRVLREHLEQLYQTLRGKATAEVGRLLAENLNNSLATVYPSFGPPSG
jgi:hypothetical protein